MVAWISVNDLNSDGMFTDATGDIITYDNFSGAPLTGGCAVINDPMTGAWSAGICSQPVPLALCSLVINSQ